MGTGPAHPTTLPPLCPTSFSEPGSLLTLHSGTHGSGWSRLLAFRIPYLQLPSSGITSGPLYLVAFYVELGDPNSGPCTGATSTEPSPGPGMCPFCSVRSYSAADGAVCTGWKQGCEHRVLTGLCEQSADRAVCTGCRRSCVDRGCVH